MSRDFSVQYTEAELEELMSQLRELPTYEKDGDYYSSADIPEACRKMGWERTPEQTAAYKSIFDKYFDAKVRISQLREMLVQLHDTSELARALATLSNKADNGFISKNKVNDLLRALSIHDPKVRMATYGQVGRAANTSDEEVSVDVFISWVGKNTV